MIILPEKQLTQKYLEERDRLLDELSIIKQDIQKHLLKLEQTSKQLFEELEKLRHTTKTIKEKETNILLFDEKIQSLKQDIISLQNEKDTYTNLAQDISKQQEDFSKYVKEIQSLLLQKDQLELDNSKLNSEIQMCTTRLNCLKNEHSDIEKQILDNTKLLQKIEQEVEHKENVEKKIAQQLHEIQIDQNNMSQYIRPIQKKLDKMGIDIDFLKFIQDLS